MITQLFRTRRTHVAAAIALAGVALIAGSSPARAQNAGTDLRWRAWLGCWNSAEAPSSTLMCVLPAVGPSAVDIATVVRGRIVNREHVFADGNRHPVAKDDCVGGETATWSATGKRVYLKAEYTCLGDEQREVSTVIAMSRDGEWLNVQGVHAGGNDAVRVVRYRPANDTVAMGPALTAQFRSTSLSSATARVAAGAPFSTSDVIEASQRLSTPVVEALLAARNENLHVDAKALVEMADAGVPGRVTDMIVALSYPGTLALDVADNQVAPRPTVAGAAGGSGSAALATAPSYCDAYTRYSPYAFSPYAWDYGCPMLSYYGDYYSPYALYGYSPYWGYGGFGLGYGGGWYPGQVVVVTQGSPTVPGHGRVINGRGYAQGSSGSGSSSGGTAAGASRPASAGGAAAARTAVPKKP